jgi:hypothetical protein
MNIALMIECAGKRWAQDVVRRGGREMVSRLVTLWPACP